MMRKNSDENKHRNIRTMGVPKGTRQNNVLPVWAAFSYFEMGTDCDIYSYLRRLKKRGVGLYIFCFQP